MGKEAMIELLTKDKGKNCPKPIATIAPGPHVGEKYVLIKEGEDGYKKSWRRDQLGTLVEIIESYDGRIRYVPGLTYNTGGSMPPEEFSKYFLLVK